MKPVKKNNSKQKTARNWKGHKHRRMLSANYGNNSVLAVALAQEKPRNSVCSNKISVGDHLEAGPVTDLNTYEIPFSENIENRGFENFESPQKLEKTQSME